ncbi:MAG: SBBP repeat-containing protein, partial [Bacteroidota bacterium]
SMVNSAGTGLVFSTFIGGSQTDLGNDIVLSNSGEIFITGRTESNDYPTTAGAYDVIHTMSFDDVYVTKLNNSGSALIYSTFVGGTLSEEAYGIDVNAAGEAFITGYTRSNDYPTTPGAFDATYGGSDEIFVTKLNAAGTALVWSSYLGDTGSERAYRIAVSPADEAFVTGYTRSNNFPTTAGALDQVRNNEDAFVTKFNTTGTALAYSTFIGGTGANEDGWGIDVNAAGEAFIIGNAGNNFPVTITGTGVGQSRDAFVARLNAAGSAFIYARYLGGSSLDIGYGIAVDNMDNVYIAGYTQSTNFPVTDGTVRVGGRDIWLGSLDPTGAIDFLTYYGGTRDDYPEQSEVVWFDNCMITSGASHSQFTGPMPTTSGAYQENTDPFTNHPDDKPWIMKWCDPILLPVNFVDFSVELQANGMAELRWVTSGEQGGETYVVERSSDLAEWQDVLARDGKGGNHGVAHYVGMDVAPLSGTGFYRVRQIDGLEGTSSYSEVRQITTGVPIRLLMAPNPSSDVVNLRLSDGNSLAAVRVLDVLGAEVEADLTQVNGGEWRLNVRALPAGIYFVGVQIAARWEFSKLVVE